MMGHYFGPGMRWGGMMIFFWPIIIIAAIFLIKSLLADDKKEADFRNETETALDIAKKRYAKGEISKEEYEEIVEEIK